MVYFICFVNKFDVLRCILLLLELNFFKLKVKFALCFYKLFKQRKVRERGTTKKN